MELLSIFSCSGMVGGTIYFVEKYGYGISLNGSGVSVGVNSHYKLLLFRGILSLFLVLFSPHVFLIFSLLGVWWCAFYGCARVFPWGWMSFKNLAYLIFWWNLADNNLIYTPLWE